MATEVRARGRALAWAPAVRPWRVGPNARALGAEWRWPVAVALAYALLLDLPLRIAQLGAARGQVFVGMLWAPHDAAQYLSAMRQGAAGSWLIHNHFSQEPHAAVVMYPFYVLLGKLAAFVGASPEEVFAWAGTMSRVVLLLAIYQLARGLTDNTAQRRLIALFVPTASGLAACLILFATIMGTPGGRLVRAS